VGTVTAAPTVRTAKTSGDAGLNPTRRATMLRSNRTRMTRIVMAALVAAVLVLGACSGSDDSSTATTAAASEEFSADAALDPAGGDGGEAELTTAQGINVATPIGTETPEGLKVIRDGRVDIRVEPGTFGQISSQLRSIAADLGGYITAGETYLQEIDDVDYAVG
jgi:hypothetical protein